MKNRKIFLTFCIPFIFGILLSFISFAQEALPENLCYSAQKEGNETDSYTRCGTCVVIEGKKGHGPTRNDCPPIIE
jgi:hypothetical protein